MTVIVLTSASPSPWTVPADFDPANNVVHMIGAGGNGADWDDGGSNQSGGGGGGGGYHSVTNFSPGGSTVAFTIGAGGSETATSMTGIGNSAAAGLNAVLGGAGGARGFGFTNNGGNGGAGSINAGGGGGGAGGPNGDGVNGTDAAATQGFGGNGDAGNGGAGSIADGGMGGAGTNISGYGAGGGGAGDYIGGWGGIGGNYGAGGGGGVNVSGGGSGASGAIIIVYTPLSLNDTGLLVRYYVDEAASGTGTPAQLLDSSGNAYHLDMYYDAGKWNWAEDGSGNRYLSSSTPEGVHRAVHAINNTSDLIRDALTNTQTATLEFVVDVQAITANNSRIGLLVNGRAGNNPTIGLANNSAAGTNWRTYWNEIEGDAGTLSLPTGRVVIHVVYDTTLATERAKVYVNGVKQWGNSTNIGQFAQLPMPADRDLIVNNRESVGTWARQWTGGFYYGALYTSAFDATRAADHSTILLADDDAPAAASTTVTDVDGDEVIIPGQTGVVITGTSFETTQSTGKVELWSDIGGTTKVQQTVTSWSDTSITISVVQGALSLGTVYLVVTSSVPDSNTPFAVSLSSGPIVTDVDIDEVIVDAQTGCIITGSNFGASQGAGKVEIWDTPQGGNPTAQTVTAWGATSITITVVKGGLSAGPAYVVVTENTGLSSSPFEVMLQAAGGAGGTALYYKPSPIADIINNVSGLDLTVELSPDE